MVVNFIPHDVNQAAIRSQCSEGPTRLSEKKVWALAFRHSLSSTELARAL